MGVASGNLPNARGVRGCEDCPHAFSHATVSGAYLQYGSTILFESPSNVTLTIGTSNQRVYCLQARGPVPTSIEWYNSQGKLVSRNGGDAVNQKAAGGGRAAHLNFHTYHQSQGGKYECRVAGPGNNTETLRVYIGEPWGDSSVSIHLSLYQQVSLKPSMPT